jgi:hypothetical protein
MSGPRYRIGDKMQGRARPWPVIDTHFGNDTVARCPSTRVAWRVATALNEPDFRPPPPNARQKKPAEVEA